MNEDDCIFEKLQELEKLVYTHENILKVLMQVMKIAGYDEDKGKTNETQVNRDPQDQ